jgi:hypothetical protein
LAIFSFTLSYCLSVDTAIAGNDLALSVAAFNYIFPIAVGPRCANCHGANGIPLQTDAGIAHAMNVSDQINHLGQRCQSCHASVAHQFLGNPPGAHEWRMPAPSMAIPKDMTARELCELWKDTSRNGNRDIAMLRDHIENDPLIKWSWNPGPGLTPAIGTHNDFVSALKRWINYGAYCP